MLTYSVYNNAKCSQKGKTWDDLTTKEKVINILITVLILVLIIWAWIRAISCSKRYPDSRATHLLFATVDPVFYLIFSYLLDDSMCRYFASKNEK